MPAAPEFRDAFGNIRVVKIFRKGKAEHVPHADGHVRIAGKIEINLEGKGQNPHPCHSHAPLVWQNAADFRPEGAGLVGEKDFFGKPDEKAAHAEGKTIYGFRPAGQLRRNGLVADDGPGDELREHGHIGAEGDQILLNRRLAAVHVDGVGHGLKRVKGNPDGQGKAKKGKFTSHEAAQGTDKKVRVLKQGQKPQIYDSRRNHGAFRGAVSAFRFKTSDKPPVEKVHEGGK